VGYDDVERPLNVKYVLKFVWQALGYIGLAKYDLFTKSTKDTWQHLMHILYGLSR